MMFFLVYFIQEKFPFICVTYLYRVDSRLKQFSNIEMLTVLYLKNKSWKPECVGSLNMDWRILVFYPEPEARDKIY